MRLLHGYYRDGDGSLRIGALPFEQTPTGPVTAKDGHPLNIRRYQPVPGTIDVKITTQQEPWVFLASKESCENSGLTVGRVAPGPDEHGALTALNSARQTTDTMAMMGEPVKPEKMEDIANKLHHAHLSSVELLGEAKRALHLLRAYEPQIGEHKQQCRASIQNLERIFSERFGLDVRQAKEKAAPSREQEPMKPEGGNHER